MIVINILLTPLEFPYGNLTLWQFMFQHILPDYHKPKKYLHKLTIFQVLKSSRWSTELIIILFCQKHLFCVDQPAFSVGFRTLFSQNQEELVEGVNAALICQTIVVTMESIIALIFRVAGWVVSMIILQNPCFMAKMQ